MKEKKRAWEFFSFYDRSGLEKRLTRMAEKGWLLEKIGSFLWTYRRIEPKRLSFCVSWFPKASAFDPGPSEEQKTFYDFCEHTGWALACSFGQMQIFYNEAEDPIPIETDPVMEVDAIHRAVKRTTLPSQLVLLVLALINGFLFVYRLLDDPIGTLASAQNLFTGFCWAVLILLIAVDCGGYFLWRRKARKAAEQGVFLETKGHRTFQKICLAALSLGMIYYLVSILTSEDEIIMVTALLTFGVYLPGVYLLTHGVMAFLKKKTAPAKVNRTVTLVVSFAAAFVLIGGITWGVLAGSSRGWFAGKDETYEYEGVIFTAPHDELPLTVEDLLDADYNGYIKEWSKSQSFLLAQYDARQVPRFDAASRREMPRLEYTITQVKLPALYGLCKNALLTDWEDDWRPDGHKNYATLIDPAPWGAEEVYQLANQEYGPENVFLLCYRDRLVEINFSEDWDVTPEQMSRVSEKIGTVNR